MAIEVFNRYENKYFVSEKILEDFQGRLSEYMELDAYNQSHDTYSITNIYYDTPDNYLIRTSLAKPSYKEKLRLRSYGVPELDSQVYIEIKKKFNGLVNKRRSSITLSDAYSLIKTGKMTDPTPRNGVSMNRQVIREIEYFLSRHEVSPAVYLAYDRKAYFGIAHEDVRISFDTNIRTRRYDLKLESGSHGQKLVEDGIWLMEIKVANNMPLWLTRLLSEFEIYPVSFSKYGTEYKKFIASPAFGGKRPAVITSPIPNAKQFGNGKAVNLN